MDESFSRWREGSSSERKNRRSSLILSESDEDSLPNTTNRQGRVVIEASDSDDDDIFSNSRTSGQWEGKSNLGVLDVPESDVTADLDDSGSSVEEAQVRNRRLKSRRSKDIAKRSQTNSEDSDTDGSYEDTEHSEDEGASHLHASHISSDSDTPIVRKKHGKKQMIFDDSADEETHQSEEQAAQTMKNSIGLGDSNAIENVESADESYHEDNASGFDASNNAVTSSSRLWSPDTPIVRKHLHKNQMFDVSVEEVKRPSDRQTSQTGNNSVGLDNLNVDENIESADESYHADNVSGFGENKASTSQYNGNHSSAMSPAEESIEVDNSIRRSEKREKSYVTISDTSESDDVTNFDAKTDLSVTSLTSTINSDDDRVVTSLAKKEIGVGNIDPLIEQKRAILTCNIEQVQRQLAKSKMILHTANIALLPDKGEKLRRSINSHEAELRKLSVELESLPKLGTPKPKVKKEPFVNAIIPPPWQTLPAPMPVKQLGQQALATHEREQSLTMERLEDLHGSLNARPSEDERAEDPKGLKVPLMPHQQHALAWLLWREKQRPHGGILADDMGLGKTLTMISLILTTIAKRDSDDESGDSDNQWVHRKKTIRPNGGTLVVCPASLLSQWEGEINRRVKRGLLSIELFHGNRREAVPRRLAKVDVVITTYNLISREYKSDSSVLYDIKWKRVILDEAHIVRNHKSQASEAVCNLIARNRWALTGTPIQNKELDLYALLKFLKCSPFDDLRVWKRWVDNKNAHGHERLATVMKTLMLRRTKVGLQALGGLGALPDKSLEEVQIKLDPEEQLVYEKVLVFSRTLFAQFLHQRAEKNHMFEVNAGKFDAPTFLQKSKNTQFTKVQDELLARHADVKAHEILVLLLRLRQVCCHPALIHAMLDQEDLKGNDIEDEGGVNLDVMAGLGALKLEDGENIDPNEIGVDRRVVENLLTTSNPVFDPKRPSSKMRAVLDTIQVILEKGDKIVVVSQWTSMLEVVRSHLKSIKGATYDILSGNVPVKNRQQIVESFNKVGSSPQILLLSLTAGGVGLNLVGGNHLLLLDIHWNPQLEAQAQDRIYRVGQTKSVYIYKFMCVDTVEQRIKALQEKKLEIAQGVLTGAGPAGASKLTLDDLKSLFSL